MVSTDKICAECPGVAVVGSRCIFCWLGRWARNHGFAKHQWFKRNKRLIYKNFQARYVAKMCGTEFKEQKQVKHEIKYWMGTAHTSMSKYHNMVAAFEKALRSKNESITGNTQN